MKKILYQSLAAIVMVGGLASCSDFLDQSSPSSFDSEKEFAEYETAQGAIGNIYKNFGEQNYRARTIWYGYNTDIELFSGSEKADGKANLATYAAAPANDQMNDPDGKDLWAQMWKGVEASNLAIEGLRKSGDLSDPKFKQLLGEALTLRALFYVDIINMWGDVPVRFEPVNATNMYAARGDRDVIYKQLIADLQEAQNLVYWPNENAVTATVERVNKAFVKGFLARVCMQAAGYAQRADGENRLSTDPELSKDVLYPIALQAVKDVMEQEGKYVALKGNFEDVWNNNGISGDVITAGSESLFEVGYSNSPVRGRIMYTFGLKHNKADDITDQLQGSQVGPMPTLFFDYSTKDLRRDITCCPFQWDQDATKKSVQVAKALKSWSFGKLRYEWTNRKIVKGNDDGINKLYMRYADVVLMRAELENELNGPSAAAPYLTKIRNRAFASTDRTANVTNYVAAASASKEKMFNAIVDERALEFAGELIRKADLIRWGKLKSKMDEAKAKMQALVNLTDYDAQHPYSQLSGHLYYKMTDLTWKRGESTNVASGAKLNFYGLNYGEMDIDPEGYSEFVDSKGDATLWIKDNALEDVIDYIYTRNPDKYQYWPIFNINLNDNPNLENYSWYNSSVE